MKPTDIAALPPGIHGLGRGLQLVVSPHGSRSWRVRVIVAGKARTSVLGPFPGLSEKVARERAAELAFELKRGIDRKAEARAAVMKATVAKSDTLAVWAGKYMKASRAEWTAGYFADCQSRIERYLAPTSLWQTPIAELDPTAVSAVLDDIHSTKPDTAQKVRILISAICRYARSKGRRDVAVVTSDLKLGSGRRGKRQSNRHLPAVLDVKALRDIIRRTEAATVSPITKNLLFLQAFTAQRSLNVCAARWQDIDLNAGLWTIPRSEMKVSSDARGDHIIPLAPFVVARLKAHKRLRLHANWVFPNATSHGHATIEGPSKFYRRGLGLADVMVPHGWRSAFKSLANAADGPDGSKLFDSQDIDAITDHQTMSKTLMAYNRMRSLPRMRRILEWWADQLVEPEYE